MPFFMYQQNNSGGYFKKGIPHAFIIEAESYSQADDIAEQNGVYFDDDYNTDCECCGMRWSRAYGDGDPLEKLLEPWQDYYGDKLKIIKLGENK